MLTDVRLTPMPILERIHRTSPKRTSCVQSDFLSELLVSAGQHAWSREPARVSSQTHTGPQGDRSSGALISCYEGKLPFATQQSSSS